MHIQHIISCLLTKTKSYKFKNMIEANIKNKIEINIINNNQSIKKNILKRIRWITYDLKDTDRYLFSIQMFQRQLWQETT